MRQGAWPRKNSEIKEGLLGEVAGTAPELGEPAQARPEVGRKGRHGHAGGHCAEGHVGASASWERS